ncbi:SRPBCC family protein [Streptomyces sp. UNOC14_S4]|uniref:SRPBCC family protein n=1 Tax=Streptomyces sp. UNOC14_S4 TaxID=2872340 RepID=UPI001E525561|nr:SRPBCC family protein [Streptomyces sp. UNOC14_S4]MCC3767953.1 SRPBCC family protein [Streptomyces sp. UNOC14_S4]
MGSVTRTATFAASADAVYAVISDARRLTGWCADFALKVTEDGDDWTVETSIGPVHLELEADPAARTVDLRVTHDIDGGADHRARTRVLENAEGGSEYVYTRIFGHGESEADATALADVIEIRLKALAASL